MSANKALEQLNCANNPSLTKLDCSDDALTQLNVGANQALRELDCSENALTELEVSQDTALRILNYANNTLEALDLKKNEHLSSLACCGNPKLSPDKVTLGKLDSLIEITCFPKEAGKKYAAIPDVNFRTYLKGKIANAFKGDWIEVDHTDVKSLSRIAVRGKQIKDLSGVEYFTALSKLDCPDNALTELNVSQNTALDTLICYNNKLNSLNTSSNKRLIYLYCRSNQITQLNLKNNEELIELYRENNRIKLLDLTNNEKLFNLNCKKMNLIA